jgi:hypothetical protein
LAERDIEIFELRPILETFPYGQSIGLALCQLSTEGVLLDERRDSLLWIRLMVPADAVPGIYTGRIEFYCDGARCGYLPLTVGIHDTLLPDPAEWALEIEVWQPWLQLGQQQGLPAFSEPWWDLARAYVMALAGLGVQRAQVGRAFCDWRRVADGQWQFDFSHLDRFRRMCYDCGICGPTSYLGMYSTTTPTEIYYLDVEKQSQTVVAEPGEEAFDEAWAAFCEALGRHSHQMEPAFDTCMWPTDRPTNPRELAAFVKAAELLRAHAADWHIGVTTDDFETALKLAEHVDRVALPLHNPADPPAEIIKELQGEGKAVWGFLTSRNDCPGVLSGLPAAHAYAVGPLAHYMGLDGVLVSSSFGDTTIRGTPNVQDKLATCTLFYVGDKVQMSLEAERLLLGLQDAELMRLGGQELGRQWLYECLVGDDWRHLSQCADHNRRRTLRSITDSVH